MLKIYIRKKKIIHELIFNDLSDRLTLKDKINIFIISLLLLIVDFLKQYIITHQTYDDDYGFLEYLFLFLISSYLYDIKFYNHQYISLIFLIIFGIIKRIIKYCLYYTDSTNIIIDLSLKIIIALFETIIFTYLKYLMEIKFFSQYKATYIVGFINGFITLILFIIFSYISVDYELVKYKDKFYFDNIFYYFDTFNIGQLILIFLFLSISLGAFKLLFNVTINYFTVCHLFLLFQNYDLSQNIIQEVELEAEFIPIFIIKLCFLIEFIFGLVFLEIIELNFCGLNKNIKRNIQKRAKEDTNLLLMNTSTHRESILMDNINDDNNDNNANNDNEVNNNYNQ